MVKLVHRLHQEDPRVVELEVGLHYGCLSSDRTSPGVVKLVMGLHHGSPMVVKLEVGLHYGCPGSDRRSIGVVKLVMGLYHGSPTVMKLEVGLHQRCFIKEQEVSRGGEASDGLHYQKCKKVKFMMELHYGNPKECEASIGASL